MSVGGKDIFQSPKESRKRFHSLDPPLSTLKSSRGGKKMKSQKDPYPRLLARAHPNI